MRILLPKNTLRKPAPPEVPEQFAKDYAEACLILNDSPQSCAALSRRILQNIIRTKANICERNLDLEITKLLASYDLPSYITEALDAIRQLGNIAAHPTKNEVTGEIIPVTYEEAEWSLTTIEHLFDFYFVQPATIAKQKDSLNKKLQAAGKPILK